MRLRVSATVVACVVASGPAFADFIVDPAQSGLAAVNITGVSRNSQTGRYAISGPVFDANGAQLQIGSLQVPGGLASLTINDQNGAYDVIGLTNFGLAFVGDESAGALTIDGAGAFIEADTTWFGLQNEATVNILNGGRYSGERTFLALDKFDGTPPGDVSVTVDGSNSTLETETVTVGSSEVQTSASAELIVSNGGLLSAAPAPGNQYSYGQIYVGSDSETRDDRLVVTGAGSRAEATDFVGLLSLRGSDRIDVLAGGSLDSTGGDIWVGGFESPAEMLVSDAGSSAGAAGDVVVGFTRFVGFQDPDTYTGPIYGRHDGTLRVANGGSLTAAGDVIIDNSPAFDETGRTVAGDPVSAELIVELGGTVTASRVLVNAGGTVSGAGGLIMADLVVNGGVVKPGASPGILTVDGNLDLLGALVEIEIGGTGIGMFDQLVVTGDVFADAGTEFVFSLFDNYELKAGDTFDFFDVDGTLDLSSAMFNLSGLGTGADISLFNSGSGLFSLRVDAVNTTSPVPLPAGSLLLLSGLGFLGTLSPAAWGLQAAGTVGRRD